MMTDGGAIASTPTALSWRDLLVPDSHLQDTLVVEYGNIDQSTLAETEKHTTTKYDYAPDTKDIPIRISHVSDLSKHMRDGLIGKLNEGQYANQANQTTYAPKGKSVLSRFESMQETLQDSTLHTRYEDDCNNSMVAISNLVVKAYKSITSQIVDRTWNNFVLPDCTYKPDTIFCIGGTDKVVILGENKAADAFKNDVDGFIQEIQKMGGSVSPFEEPLKGPPFTGAHAILLKLASAAAIGKTRWAVIFGGDRYVVIYISYLHDRRPVFYISDTHPFSRNGLNEDARQPDFDRYLALWGALVYMLLTVDDTDETLMQVLHLRRLPEDNVPLPPMGRQETDDGILLSARLNHQPIIRMSVHIPHFQPINLTLADCPLLTKAGGSTPFVKIDRTDVGRWSIVHTSPSTNLVLKFPNLLNGEDVGVCRLLEDERQIYEHLPRLCRLVTPHFYGAYDWHGGRVLAFSYEGTSLADLGVRFSSLELIERILLYCQLWLLHLNKIQHNDFETRNVLRKGWARFVIIDFALARADHACPGWRSCRELVEARRALGLEGVKDAVARIQGVVKGIRGELLFFHVILAVLAFILVLILLVRHVTVPL
ncbi:uncharacterized protein LAESUDRAFT_757001 [Laetiporus sulphureus 93-53]|uniref:Protein kinase domain-containing protein n=1 Tax=Laetiporus sulphureus 93-53 TaxID=1314785 RepID=A0A165FTD3_9APHY|nr:uncharacterized protein LAESUDRAFT_757001 [Laetiporus sulphureus 93-53]KZT09384.1 hypothetical protein LAESUDRAFT_757001 [Laetiporus sulphureus 93-53]